MNMRKILAIVLACLMVLPFMVACSAKPAATEAPKAETTVTEAPKAEEPKAEEPKAEEPKAEEPAPAVRDENTPLVVAYSPFSAKFSPFYADTAYDQDVVAMTQISLMTTDRMRGVIYNGIEGETVAYNGTDYLYTGAADLKVEYDEATDTTKYTAKLRDDLKFSDGEPVTADDVIFTYYTYLDPSYAGSTTLGSYGILGVDAYKTQVPEEGLALIQPVFDAILAAGTGYELKADDTFTQEQYECSE